MVADLAFWLRESASSSDEPLSAEKSSSATARLTARLAGDLAAAHADDDDGLLRLDPA